MTTSNTEPVVIVAYDPGWPRRFGRVRDELLDALRGRPVLGIQHIGSTAVPGLAGKPVIDVAVEVPDLGVVDDGWVAGLRGAGFVYVPEYEAQIPLRRYFHRPAAAGRLACHVHVEVPGSEPWLHHVRFRDALLQSPELCRRYAELKRTLQTRFERDREAYTEGKTSFIRAVLEEDDSG